MQDDELLKTVGADLHALIRNHGVGVLSATPISSLPSPVTGRAVFRVVLADGRTLKARRFTSAEAAANAEWAGSLLPGASFPRVLGRRHLGLLTEWVDGTPLDRLPITNAVLERAGALLRVVHTVELPRRQIEETRSFLEMRSNAWLRVRANQLQEAGRISATDVESATSLADANRPARFDVTLVHGDLTPENIVIAPDGRLHVVDNDTVAIHAPEFDLARTLYRWPMDAGARRSFERGYGAADVLASYAAHATYWTIVVLIGAAAFRLRERLSPDPAIVRLRTILDA